MPQTTLTSFFGGYLLGVASGAVGFIVLWSIIDWWNWRRITQLRGWEKRTDEYRRDRESDRCIGE